jgi:hypothetical protein
MADVAQFGEWVLTLLVFIEAFADGPDHAGWLGVPAVGCDYQPPPPPPPPPPPDEPPPPDPEDDPGAVEDDEIALENELLKLEVKADAENEPRAAPEYHEGE